MELIGFRRTAEVMFTLSIQERESRNSCSIQLSVTGHLQPHGLLVRSSRMSHAESTRNYTTQRTLAKSGTISQTMSSTLSGANQRWPKISKL